MNEQITTEKKFEIAYDDINFVSDDGNNTRNRKIKNNLDFVLGNRQDQQTNINSQKIYGINTSAGADKTKEKEENKTELEKLTLLVNKHSITFGTAEDHMPLKMSVFWTSIVCLIFLVITMGITVLNTFIIQGSLTETTAFIIVLLCVFEEVFVSILHSLLSHYAYFDWAGLVLLFCIYFAIFFLLFVGFKFWSAIIVNLIVDVYVVGFYALIRLTKDKFNSLKRYTPNFHVTVIILSMLIVFLAYKYLSTYPGILIWIIIFGGLSILVQYTNEITEILEGATGSYWEVGIVVRASTICRLMLGAFLATTIMLHILKESGLVFPIWVWWDPYLYGLTIPKSVFSWL